MATRVSNEEAILEALDAAPAPRLDGRAVAAAAGLIGAVVGAVALRRSRRG
ncbi:MAG: hypothetical protein ACKO2C_09455 [Actinomycetes bacterium]